MGSKQLLSRESKFFLIFTFLSLSIVIWYFTITIRNTNGFFYGIVSIANLSVENGELTCPEFRSAPCRDFMGYPIILGVLITVTNASTGVVQLLPVGLFTVPIVWAVLIKQFTTDIRTIFLFTIPFLVNPSYIFGHQDTFAYTWSRTLYFASLLTLIILVKSQRGNNIHYKLFLILGVLSLGLLNVYWSSAGWLTLNLAILAVVLWWIQDKKGIPIILLSLSVCSLFLSMPTISRNIVQIFITQVYDGPSQGIFAFIETIRELTASESGGRPSIEQSTVESIGQTVWDYARIARYLILFGAAGLLTFPYLKVLFDDIHNKNRKISWRTIIIICIAGAIIVHTFVYVFRGRPSLRLASITLPIIVLALSYEIDKPYIAVSIGTIFTLVSIFALIGFIATTGLTPVAAHHTTDNSASWIEQNNKDTNIRVAGDFHSVEAQIQHTITDQTDISPVYYRDAWYDWVVMGHNEMPEADFIIINKAQYDRVIRSPGYQRFPPFKAYHEDPSDLAIERYPSINSIYDDNHVRIYGTAI